MIQEIIENLKSCKVGNVKQAEGLNLSSIINERKDKVYNPMMSLVPFDLKIWWEQIYKAELFKDLDFGQWGLIILPIEEALKETKESINERPQDFKESDLVIGKFVGDSELLVVTLEKNKFGNIKVALPIDKRNDWYNVASSFTEFLCFYLQNNGEKYWE
jgi:hypothetical protein